MSSGYLSSKDSTVISAVVGFGFSVLAVIAFSSRLCLMVSIPYISNEFKPYTQYRLPLEVPSRGTGGG